MTELEKIENAKAIISKLAKGINPLDDSEIPESDLLNNVTISRCMYYASDVLQGICDYLKSNTNTPEEAEPHVKRWNGLRSPFTITPEQLKNYQFEDEPIGIRAMTAKINALVDPNEVKRLKIHSITKWLLANEMIVSNSSRNGTYYTPTQKGEELGITTKFWTHENGQLHSILVYTLKAQLYILDHIEEIVKINNEKESTNRNYRKQWDPEQEEKLIELFNYGLEIADIAVEMERTRNAIRTRLKMLGLIKSK